MHWVTGPLLRLLNESGKKLSELEIKAEHFAELIEMVVKKKITELQAKEILKKFSPKSFSPSKEAKEKITDEKELEKIVKNVIGKNSKVVSDYKNGEKNALNYLMGEIMKASEKRADFAVARRVLEKMLK